MSVFMFFRDMLSKGRSLPWRDILGDYTNNREISSSHLLKFFGPLDLWLDDYIKDNDIPKGW